MLAFANFLLIFATVNLILFCFILQKLFEICIPLGSISLGFVLLSGSMVFISTIFLYPSREILQAELDAANHYKLKPSEFTKMITSSTTKEKEDKKNKNLMEYGGMHHKYERQYHYDVDDSGDDGVAADKWSESPLASSYFIRL